MFCDIYVAAQQNFAQLLSHENVCGKWPGIQRVKIVGKN